MYLPYPNSIPNKGYSICILSESGEEKEWLLKRDLSKYISKDFGPTINSYIYKDTVCFWESFFDTIYGISRDHKVIPRWSFKHNYDHLSIDNQMKGIFDIKQTYNFGKVVETSGFFFFSGYNHGKALKILYDKKLKNYQEVVYNFDLFDHGFHNDLDGGVPFWPKGTINDSMLYSYMEPNDYLEIINSNYNKEIIVKGDKGSQILKKFNEKITPMSNPILIIVTLE
jgi:hypothetical protein